MSGSFKEKYGSYAIVTGASAGIGRAIATEIAAKGVNLVLVARGREKLDAFSQALTEQFGIGVKCLSIDLSEDGAVRTLASETSTLDIGLLVLNAGVVHAGGFLTNGVDLEIDLVKFNTVVTTKLAHLVGSRMKLAGRGGIIFVSSMAALGPAPYQATYAASKAYISSLGRAMAVELSGTGVDVSVLIPGMTDTDGTKNTANIDYSKMKGVTMMSAVDVAKAALKGLGNEVDIIPGAKNRFGAFLFGHMSQNSVAKMVGKMTLGALDHGMR